MSGAQIQKMGPQIGQLRELCRIRIRRRCAACDTTAQHTAATTAAILAAMACGRRPHIPATTTHICFRVHIGALLEQQRRGGRATPRSREVKGRATLLHTGERGEESGRACMRRSRGMLWWLGAMGSGCGRHGMMNLSFGDAAACTAAHKNGQIGHFFALDQSMSLALPSTSGV